MTGLRNWFRASSLDRQLQDEVAFHLETPRPWILASISVQEPWRRCLSTGAGRTKAADCSPSS
jgi:hypothetical protein